MESYGWMLDGIISFYLLYQVSIIVTCFALLVLICIALALSCSKANMKLRESSNSLGRIERANTTLVGMTIGRSIDDQDWRDVLQGYIKLTKFEISQLSDRNDNQTRILIERDSEIERLKGISEDHYQCLTEARTQRDSALEEAQDLANELELLKEENKKIPDYEAVIQKSVDTLEQTRKQISGLTSSRDNFRNDVTRLEDYAKKLEASMDKAKGTYTSKLEKLRKAIRGEGWGYRLNGRKIVLFEIEG